MMDENGIVKPDHAYPILMNLLPVGLKGVAFAALTAAIVASLAGKANSISTIFSLDIYKKYIHKDANDGTVVLIGRYAVIISMVIAALVAPSLRTLDQAYQFIQEYVGFISPGVLAIFLMGLFWRRVTSSAALTGALLTIPLSTLLKFLPALTNGSFPDFPFLDRMTITFVVIVIIMIAMSLLWPEEKKESQHIEIDTRMFKVTPAFTVGSVLILGILAALYTVFW
jgi:SSS family solute:Na+ symporter